MPAIPRSEFTLALNQVATERGVDASVVLETVKNAILAAYRKDHPGVEVEKYSVDLNAENGETKILHKGEDVTPPGFGRIAAQTAKQVILQKIREAEKDAIFGDYANRMGTVVNGMVLRLDGPNVIVDVGRAEAIMPPQEQIPNEHYRLNQRMSVYLVEIREGMRGREIVASRAHKGLLEGLFRREVPEVAQGAVTIKEIAREPGSRSKIAVFSSQSGVDPVGSCVGQKGVRVQAVIGELGGLEKIDIIQWSENKEQFIQSALSPAKDVSVKYDEKTRLAVAVVSDEELSLAIGREGQNVRLAGKLTGCEIKMKGRSEASGKKPVSKKEEVQVPQPESKEEVIEEKKAEEKVLEKKGV